jgi:hypothetical protein
MMTAHARASQWKEIFSVRLIKIRSARRQLFSSIDCFDVLEHGNECCDPSRIERRELLRTKRFEKRT